MVDITNTKELKATLDKLNEYAEPLWGTLNPQQAIEHLTTTFPIVNGRKEMAQVTTPEEAIEVKKRLIGNSDPMPKGIKSVMMPGAPPAYLHPSLQAAKNELLREVEEFNTNVKKNPNGSALHPRMGQMNWQEWTTLFNKHFTHHFEQFGLLNA